MKGKLMFKLLLLLGLALAFIVTSPRNAPLQQQNQAVQCLPEVMARKLAEDTTLPEYPEETEPGTSQGVVFAAALFGTDGKLSGIRIYETPNEQFSDAVKAAMQKWKLKEFFNGAQEPIMTRTGIRFHFVFDGGNGRVDLATEQEQNEFGGEWGKRVCRGSFDE